MARKQDGGYRIPQIIDPLSRRCVKFWIPNDLDHFAAFWGAVDRLTYWHEWERDNAQSGKKLAEVWREVIFSARQNWLSEAPCDGDNPPCLEVAPHHPAFEFHPQNPYTEPNFVPPAYTFPPFYLGNSLSQSLYDTPIGAVVTTLERLLPDLNPLPPWDPILFNFPRFTLRFSGIGTVELHLCAVNQGGLAQITVDEQLLSLQVIDLFQDTASIPPETENNIIIERTFETGGPHRIDVIFLPNLNDAFPPLFFGGGVVKAVFCGQFNSGEPNYVIRANPNDPCEIEQSADGVNWTSIFRLDNCQGMDGREVEMRVSGGYIQWRLAGDINWVNLIAIADLSGQDGQSGIDGRDVEMGINGNYIAWRLVGDVDWHDLIAIEDLRGADGQDGENGQDGRDGQRNANLFESSFAEDSCQRNAMSEWLKNRVIADLDLWAQEMMSYSEAQWIENRLKEGGFNWDKLGTLYGALVPYNNVVQPRSPSADFAQLGGGSTGYLADHAATLFFATDGDLSARDIFRFLGKRETVGDEIGILIMRYFESLTQARYNELRSIAYHVPFGYCTPPTPVYYQRNNQTSNTSIQQSRLNEVQLSGTLMSGENAIELTISGFGGAALPMIHSIYAPTMWTKIAVGNVYGQWTWESEGDGLDPTNYPIPFSVWPFSILSMSKLYPQGGNGDISATITFESWVKEVI